MWQNWRTLAAVRLFKITRNQPNLSLALESSKEFDQFEVPDVAAALILLEDLSEPSFITSNSFSQLLDDFELLPPNPSKNSSSPLLLLPVKAFSFLLFDPKEDALRQSLKCRRSFVLSCAIIALEINFAWRKYHNLIKVDLIWGEMYLLMTSKSSSMALEEFLDSNPLLARGSSC